MFDEFVEHAGSPPRTSVNVAGLEYQGFEPVVSDVNPSDTRAELEDIATGHHYGTLSAAAQIPIFDLGRVQFPLPAQLVSLVVASDILAMALSNNVLMMIELAHPETVIPIPIPRKNSDMSIHKIFLDPSGRHLLITSQQGENWYLSRGWKKPKLLKSFKMVVESVAWNKPALLSSAHSTSSREILIGSSNGAIYEALLDASEDLFKSHDRYCQVVYLIPEKPRITGIKFDFFPYPDPKKALVVATTFSRIYQFVGAPDRRPEESKDSGRVFTNIFAAYRDTAPKISELPGELQYSALQFFTPNADQALSLPKTMAWLTGPGIYHGSLNFLSNSDDFIDNAQLLPYHSTASRDRANHFSPSASEIPVSITLTEFHFILLYYNRVVGVCNLDDQVTYEESLPLRHGEEVRGMTADPVRNTYWVYTNLSIFELTVTNETRDIWKIYLSQEKYDVALRFAKIASQRDAVLSAQANALFKEGRYFPAAQTYSQCSVTFEEVTLKFLDVGERDALRSYLTSRLERTRKSDFTQRMMLATWLIEFYLSKCNELDDVVASESISHDVDNLKVERNILEDDFKQFFVTYKNDLNPSTVYELIQSHGRTDMYIYYATTIADFERVIDHWIEEEVWLNAIDAINRQEDLEQYYKYSSVLMRQVPKETVDSWLRQPLLDPLRLVPALLQQQHASPNPLIGNQATRYLNQVVFGQHNSSSTIHNLLITFYLSSTPSQDDDAQLVRFLQTAPADPITDKPYYDLDYALRLCRRSGRTQPCALIYAKMGMWENSVDLALDKGDLDLAKQFADMPEEDESLRKKLWLKVAKYVVQDKKDIKTAMHFLESTVLKIEDILPFFPDFVVIDDFKEEIANALEGYSKQIEVLKYDMEEATRTAESIKQDILALKERFFTVEAGERCSVCSQSLFTRQFYVFPCYHTFHADCLIGLAKECLPSHALRRIIALQAELLKVVQPINRATGASATEVSGVIQQHQRKLLSANFAALTAPLQAGNRAAGQLGRNLILAGDKVRDLIVPDALAAIVTAPAGWIPGLNRRQGLSDRNQELKAEQLRVDLDEELSSSCPLCESVVSGLDRAFVKEGEVDSSWTI